LTTKVVRLKNFAEELKRDTNIRLESYQAAVANGVLQSLPDLVASSPVDTGQYAASWDFTFSEEVLVLGNFAPHAPIIEEGARPFTPPIRPLLAWAKRVLQDGSQPPDYSPRVWALAKGVQNKIKANGMMPRHILRNAIPRIIDNIKRELKIGNR